MATWERGEWMDWHGTIRREYRCGSWLITEGWDHAERDAGRPWALVDGKHAASFHRTPTEAKRVHKIMLTRRAALDAD